MARVKVTVTTEEGEVLDSLFVTNEGNVPVSTVARSVLETVEESFETSDE